jgi:AbiV family abortive infection protein
VDQGAQRRIHRTTQFSNFSHLSKNIVSQQVLLEGAWYALEQAGRLLSSAVRIHDAGDPVTGLATAMLAREELERSKILQELGENVNDEKPSTVQMVRGKIVNHVPKQAKSMGGTALRIRPETQLAKALKTMSENPPSSEAWQNANKLLNAETDAQRKRNPNDRHNFRMASIYVDLTDDGKS